MTTPTLTVREVLLDADSALEQLYVAHWRGLVRLAVLLLRDQGEADRRDAVLDALRELPTRQREVLVLRHYLELSETEIGETLGISRGSVKAHASRGGAALRALLADAHEGKDL